MKKLSIPIVIAVLAGFIIGLIWTVALRAVLIKNTAPHYHANFGVFVDGQRLKFEGPTFYEEVAACSTDGVDPKHRAHMHEQVNSVVHVHDDVVTWADFFANLRYSLGDRVLQLDDVVLVDGVDGKSLSFILNGQPVEKIANRVIGNEDILLVSYGIEDAQATQAQYSQIPKTADEYNHGTDPSSCQGSEEFSLLERLKRAVQVNPGGH